ncbi:MAG: hypothetical protein WDZ62_01375 [Candidatus Pacearchaeota archaeon]
MKTVGFNFTKISVERTEDFKGSVRDIKVDSSLNVSDIEELKSHLLKTKDQVIKSNFKYGINYDPNFAKVNIEGNVIITVDPKLGKKILKEWKKKKIEEEFQIYLFNVIIKKATLRALYLEEELNLPTHFPLPSVKKKK